MVWDYIKSDLFRYAGEVSVRVFVKQFFINRSFKYSFWLRLTRHSNFFLRVFARGMHRWLSNRYLIQIPRGVEIGYGLYIGHHMCVVVNKTAKIGNNVNLSQFTTIGSNRGRAATIGDNVYIGPSVSIVEDVRIGNNATIGAGSVVTKDVPENATVGGVPARTISFKDPGRFVNRRWEPVKS